MYFGQNEEQLFSQVKLFSVEVSVEQRNKIGKCDIQRNASAYHLTVRHCADEVYKLTRNTLLLFLSSTFLFILPSPFQLFYSSNTPEVP